MTSTWIGPMAAIAVWWVCGVTQAQAFSITHTLASGTNAFAMTTLLNTQIPVQNPVKSTSMGYSPSAASPAAVTSAQMVLIVSEFRTAKGWLFTVITFPAHIAPAPPLQYPDGSHTLLSPPVHAKWAVFSFLGVQIICRMGILGDDHLIVFPAFGYSNDIFTAASHSLLPSAPVMNSFCASVITNTFFAMFPLLYSFSIIVCTKAGNRVLRLPASLTYRNNFFTFLHQIRLLLIHPLRSDTGHWQPDAPPPARDHGYRWCWNRSPPPPPVPLR